MIGYRLVKMLLPCCIISIACGNAPYWFKKQPAGYVAAAGYGLTPEEANTKAWSHLFSELARNKTDRVSEDFKILTSRINEKKIQQISQLIDIDGNFYSGGKPLFRVMENRYGTKNSGSEFSRHLLVCLSDSKRACRLDYPSDGAAAFRASLLPGLGHIYKKRTKRGIGFLTAVSVPVAGGLMALGVSNVYFKSSAEARSSRLSDEYRSRGYAFNWIGLGALAIGCGIYIWNIFDALNCEGVPEFR